MRITDLLTRGRILLNADPVEKSEAIDRLIALHLEAGNLADPAEYRRAILAREAEGTTALGADIAVPHAKSRAVLRPGLVAMTVPAGIPYGAPDGAPSRLFFMIAAPGEARDLHLEILARLMALLSCNDLRGQLLTAPTPRAFLAAVAAAEQGAFPGDFPTI